MIILAISPKDILNLPNWQKLWEQRATNNYETLELGGYSR
jgi:hypothetical protein